ncbi:MULTISPECIES: trehalose-6-phosphate synthase [Crocosphaera]|uniref:trehalose-6-phosphate synthase n=1 Tax=Crocosphaera watsonii TaxID=263511 RepID=UPI0009D64023|nr:MULTISPECIES: trehalose-6-phosphate synthase [Crocosphaera]
MPLVWVFWVAIIIYLLNIIILSLQDYSSFNILPWREAIVDSVLCCDVLGFHIQSYSEKFTLICGDFLL